MISFTAIWADSAPRGCGTAHKQIFLSTHPLLDAKAGEGFSDGLRRQLQEPLVDLGYCLVNIENYRTLLDTVKFGENLVLHVLVSEGPDPLLADGTGSGTLLVAILTVHDWVVGKLPEAVAHPLVTLRFHATEDKTLTDIVAKKIAENLRSQFVAQLLIQSQPPGAKVLTEAGLHGITPVEWVVPLEILAVRIEKPGYLPLSRKLDLTNPGMHTFDIQLTKRRFFHSKLIYPTLFFGAGTGIAFVFENHYYSQYRDLGAQDQKNNPERFANTFHKAKSLERIGFTSLVLAATCLAFSFRF